MQPFSRQKTAGAPFCSNGVGFHGRHQELVHRIGPPDQGSDSNEEAPRTGDERSRRGGGNRPVVIRGDSKVRSGAERFVRWGRAESEDYPKEQLSR